MFPRCSSFYITHMIRPNSVFKGNFMLGALISKNCQNLFFSEFCAMAFFSPLIAWQTAKWYAFSAMRAISIAFGHPSFFNGILYVVFFGSKEKVFWIAANHVVTFMQNEKTIGDFAVSEYPRYAMRDNQFIIYGEPAIREFPAKVDTVASPRPANIAWPARDFLPKQGNRFCFEHEQIMARNDTGVHCG